MASSPPHLAPHEAQSGRPFLQPERRAPPRAPARPNARSALRLRGNPLVRDRSGPSGNITLMPPQGDTAFRARASATTRCMRRRPPPAAQPRIRSPLPRRPPRTADKARVISCRSRRSTVPLSHWPLLDVSRLLDERERRGRVDDERTTPPAQTRARTDAREGRGRCGGRSDRLCVGEAGEAGGVAARARGGGAWGWYCGRRGGVRGRD